MSNIERHVERAVNGTFQIGPRLFRWPAHSEGARQFLARVLALAAGAWTAWRLGNQWPWLWALMVAAAVIAGYTLADTPAKAAEEDEEESGPVEDDPELETAEEDRPRPSPAEIRQILIDSVRDLAGERQGVHLDQMHAVWSLEGDLGMDLSEFRRWVEQHGIPVRDSLKASGKTRIGIHLADLPRRPPTEPTATTPPAVPDDLLQDWSSPQVNPRTTP